MGIETRVEILSCNGGCATTTDLGRESLPFAIDHHGSPPPASRWFKKFRMTTTASAYWVYGGKKGKVDVPAMKQR